MELNLNSEESENKSESNSNNSSKEKINENNNNINKNINEENNLNREMFEFITVIGKGGFGKVWKVQYKKTKEYFALKEMSKRKILDKKSEKSINSEMKFLSILNHPFIVNMHYAFQDNDNLYLVMDMLSGGDLRYHCSRYRTFSEEQTRFFIACITYSLEYIHSNNVIHRDIKPENLVLDEKGYVRVTDFGIAKYNTKDNSSETSGTPGYMSPEVMNAENHTFTADFFAIGVIGFEFLMGYRPYNGKNRQEIKEKIFSGQVIISPEQKKNGWSDDVLDFINKLLERNKESRLGAINGFQELKEHQWLKYYPWDELEKKVLPAPFIPEQIDNFDKSYCESEEKITENTKIRYKKIYSSLDYKKAFVDFFFNKEIEKFKRKQEKSNKVKNIIKQEEKEKVMQLNESKSDIDKNNENKDYPEILSIGSENIDNKNNNNTISVKTDKQKDVNNKDLEKNIKENKILNNSNNINKAKNPKNEKTEEEITLKKMELNSEGSHTKIYENNSNIHNFRKESTTNSLTKLSENPKYINQYNTNNFIQINNFKKIIINHNDIKKKTKEDFFFKEYLRYNNNNNKKQKKFNYMLKLKKGNNHPETKSSSMIFNSSKKDNNNNSDFIINNNFPKREESQNNIKNKTIYKHFVLNNNNSNANITNNFIMNNNINYNNYTKDKNQIKYQKLKLKKKHNNSFRINHIKNLFNGQKINSIKNLYIDRNESLTRKLDKKNYDRTYMYYNTKKDIIKINDKKIPKLPGYLNNHNFNSNLSGDNTDNNIYSYKTNNISLYKLNNTNNDYSFNYANSLNNITYKDKNFNFKKVPKIKSTEKNIIFNRNNFPNKSRTNSNMKIKNFERINSAGKFKCNGVKIDKNNSINNKTNIKKYTKEKIRAKSNKKDLFQHYLLS